MTAGRPSPIDAVFRHRDDGTPVTVADQIIAGLDSGNYFEFSCASAGITKETGYEWLRVAARALLAAKGRDLATLNLPAHTLRCIEFSDAVLEADARWTVRANGTLEQLARGGIEQTTTTTKRGPSTIAPNGDVVPGPVLEETTRTTHTLPDAQVIMWRLTRRHPDLYGHKIEVRTPGAALDPGEHATKLMEGIESFLADVDAAASVRSKAKS